jgi:hypothetical protein
LNLNDGDSGVSSWNSGGRAHVERAQQQFTEAILYLIFSSF